MYKKVVRNVIILLAVIAALIFGIEKFAEKKGWIEGKSKSHKEISADELFVINSEEDLENLPDDVDWDKVVFVGGIPDFTDEENEEYEARIRAERESTQSDIEGWTLQDKYDAGFYDLSDGSDNDGDGLTDKEEIEIYGSDPLKTSTADDLYTDGYKVANGMDVNTKYPYEGSYEFPNKQECDEVTLIPKTVSDFNAYFWDSTGYCEEENSLEFYQYSWLDEYTYYKDYSCNGFGGTLKIDLSQILEENNIKAKDIIVLTTQNRGYDYDLTQIDYTLDGNEITLEEGRYYLSAQIIIANKHKRNFVTDTMNSIGDTIDGISDTINGTVTVSENTMVILEGSQIGSAIGLPGLKSRLYYASCGDEDIDKGILERVLEEIHPSGYGLSFFHWNDLCVEDAQLLSVEDFEKKYSKLQEKYPDGEIDPRTRDFIKWSKHIFYRWDDNSKNSAAITHSERVINYEIGDGNFFPFENFGSYISPGGNCAGIAEITALVHNKGTVEAGLSYIGNENTAYKGNIEYNLSGSERNKTLLDPGLFDCRDSRFRKTVESTAMEDVASVSNSDANLINCIGLYWAWANDMTRDARRNLRFESVIKSKEEAENLKNDYSRIANYGYDISMLYDVMDALDRGEYLNLAISRQGQDRMYAHAINIIGYNAQINDITGEINELTLYVYDNAYGAPNRIYTTNEERGIQYDNKITIHPDGGNGFWYTYVPIKSGHYSNCLWEGLGGESYFFVVYDDEYHILSKGQ